MTWKIGLLVMCTHGGQKRALDALLYLCLLYTPLIPLRQRQGFCLNQGLTFPWVGWKSPATSELR